jgi:hypothetical protein
LGGREGTVPGRKVLLDMWLSITMTEMRRGGYWVETVDCPEGSFPETKLPSMEKRVKKIVP